MWCLGQMDAAYIAQMEHILDLYAEPRSPEVPLVNVDEVTKQLVGEVKACRPMRVGQAGKTDYEYERKGVANIFLCLDRHRGWRHVKVMDTKRTADFYGHTDASRHAVYDGGATLALETSMRSHYNCSRVRISYLDSKETNLCDLQDLYSNCVNRLSLTLTIGEDRYHEQARTGSLRTWKNRRFDSQIQLSQATSLRLGGPKTISFKFVL